jgi:hypothetical protein
MPEIAIDSKRLIRTANKGSTINPNINESIITSTTNVSVAVRNPIERYSSTV